MAAESDLYVITEWVKQGLTSDGVFLPRWPFVHHIPVTPQLCSAFSSCPRPFPAGHSPKRSFFFFKKSVQGSILYHTAADLQQREQLQFPAHFVH